MFAFFVLRVEPHSQNLWDQEHNNLMHFQDCACFYTNIFPVSIHITAAILLKDALILATVVRMSINVSSFIIYAEIKTFTI